ncbi:hypothetical protein [uncultured Cardiobacterium sp.]|uniref:hypothetical protein n=1 Tax=uncultured Cardiobacterium sp. TaxID=417619 RepID=UPI00261D050D|nr:hypothetical protein [uncultured Cardiobacterium sp.]
MKSTPEPPDRHLSGKCGTVRAKNWQGLTLSFWQSHIDGIIAYNDFAVLEGKGTRSRKQMEALAKEQYALFRQNRLAQRGRREREILPSWKR